MPAEPVPVALNYSAAFLRHLKRLSEKYRRIRLLLARYSKTEQSDIAPDGLQRILDEELRR